MRSLVVVVRQVTQHIGLSLILAAAALFRYPFRFQASEKNAPSRCPAVTEAAHALLDTVAPEHLAKLKAGAASDVDLVHAHHRLKRVWPLPDGAVICRGQYAKRDWPGRRHLSCTSDIRFPGRSTTYCTEITSIFGGRRAQLGRELLT